MGASGGAVATSVGTSAAVGFLTGGPIGAAIGAITASVQALLTRVGPKQNVATTNIVNQAEPLLQQQLAAWNASTKNCNEQAQCVTNFQNIWNAVCNACAQPSLGDPGHSCLDDRLPAGVKFAYNTFNIVGNGMFDWFHLYLFPILNDPAVAGCCAPQACYDPLCTAPVAMPACVPSVASAAGAIAAGSVAGIPLSYILIAAAVALGLWVIS